MALLVGVLRPLLASRWLIHLVSEPIFKFILVKSIVTGDFSTLQSNSADYRSTVYETQTNETGNLQTGDAAFSTLLDVTCSAQTSSR